MATTTMAKACHHSNRILKIQCLMISRWENSKRRLHEEKEIGLSENCFCYGTVWIGFTTILRNLCNWRLCLLLSELPDPLQCCVCNISRYLLFYSWRLSFSLNDFVLLAAVKMDCALLFSTSGNRMLEMTEQTETSRGFAKHHVWRDRKSVV